MGRKPSKPGAIPRFRVRRRGAATYYFYDHGGTPRREEPLGRDYGLAIKRWAEIEHESAAPPQAVVTFKVVADAYRVAVIPTKADRTQRDNMRELAKLLEFFDDPPCPIDAIEPKHVQAYLDWRGTKVRAVREKALLSHLWNWARRKGYTSLPNPCAGVTVPGTGGRTVYLEDEDYRAVWTAAGPCLRDAMDLAYLTGQRPGDVLAMTEMDVRDGTLHVTQGKTGTRMRLSVAGSLPALLDRIRARKAGYRVHNTRLVVNEAGRPLGVHAISVRWKAACLAAGVEGFQFRDIRSKAATDAEDAGGLGAAQKLMGHKTQRMTEHYVKNRKGSKVELVGELRKLHPDAEMDAPAEGKEKARRSGLSDGGRGRN